MPSLVSPYAEKAPQLLTGSLRHKWSATITTPAGTTNLAIESGSITFDESWSPHMQGKIRTVTGTNAELMDPRGNALVEVQAGYIYPGGEKDIHALASGVLTERPFDRATGTLNLAFESGETKALDSRFVGGGTIVPPWAGVKEFIEWCIRYADPGATIVWADWVGQYYRPDLVADANISPARNMWEIIEDAALRIGMWVRADAAGNWIISKKASVYGQPAHIITNGLNGTVEEMTETLTRRDWYQEVCLAYVWKDKASGEEITAFGMTRRGYPTTPLTDGAGRKVYFEQRPGPIPNQTAANYAAYIMLRNLNTRGARYEITAHSAYWLRPGMTVTVSPDGLTQTREIVQSVTFNTDGFMTLTTRRPLETED